ncbi:MAG: Ig-like domain-containing protein, partial [Gemmatimonadetes bacterium]|nr:Ig-like domain-containing protein [Gemmatimonadota bacterium]
LRVIRSSPEKTAAPTDQITVTFDRPVAGSLERTVDASKILRVAPEIPGRIEWRDPVTIRLVPTAPLPSGRSYTVTVATGFRAMDGSALGAPHSFTFRVRGATLIGGAPLGPNVGRHAPPVEVVRQLTPAQHFRLVYTTAVDLAALSSSAFIELNRSCGGESIVRLTATAQRRITKDDDERLRFAGGGERDEALDSLRRVVDLVPRARLPRACAGQLVVPSEVSTRAEAEPVRLPFETYGDFRIESATCADAQTYCPTGPVRVNFTTPVRGAEVQRRLTLFPRTKFVVRDTLAESTTWTLEGTLKLRTTYAIVADTAMRDAFGQPLKGNPAVGITTTGYQPAVVYAYGRQTVERVGFRTLAVQHVNVDTLVTTVAPVPVDKEPAALGFVSMHTDSLWNALMRAGTVQRVAVRNRTDTPIITGVRLPVQNAAQPGTPTLFAVRVTARAAGTDSARGNVALLQVTDLGVHAKIGLHDGIVWVTGISDGLPKADAVVVVHDAQGRTIGSARTDAQGIARFASLNYRPERTRQSDDDDFHAGYYGRPLEGYVSATLGADRAITAITTWDPDLAPYNFDVSSAWGDDRLPLAGAVFVERGIYRPGERVYAKAIIRDGLLGALRAPAAGDSVRFVFQDREGATLRESASKLSAFGTADQSFELPAGAAVGEYSLNVRVRRVGQWRDAARTSYRVAEYRPPEFLVDLSVPPDARMPGDKLTATLQARYLFGAPMGRAAVEWSVRQEPEYSWSVPIDGSEDWYLGDLDAWWEQERSTTEVVSSRTDTLDSQGSRTLTVTLPEPSKGQPSRVTVEANVTDVNRQVVGASASAIVHPAAFYVAAKTAGSSWFWKAGTPQTVLVTTVRPDGQHVTGVRVQGTIVRREWHRVRRQREGVSELVGEWVADTVARCSVVTQMSPVTCGFTPRDGGEYTVRFTATDARGRVARTSFSRWSSGEGWVPWNDETQFKMSVIADRKRYTIGDTATIMFASPFTDAEAWITVEREGLLEQRRMRVTSGSTTLKFPITEAYAPNAFVGIVVVRGRSAKPGYFDDLGRPTMRVGYAELRVTPEVKRLAVDVAPERSEYRPGDSARVRLRVRDAQKRGARSEVTLWAVDEGVLSLTGYRTPDPLDLLYRERGLGLRLASNMSAVAPQVPEGEKGWRNAGGSGGAAGADVLRSRFQTTAFFLGSVVTDAQGVAVATAKLPDNITTFRVMAVAVTAGDRFGKGESPMLVTRPLLARQALPRFVRPGDAFTAGAVINRRDGAAVPVRVRAASTGATLQGATEQTATLAAQRGAEVRFPFVATRADSASFRFDVSDDRNADAVRVTVPVRPDHHPVVHTLAGMVRDSASVELALPAGMDLERSRLSLNIGASPLATIRGIRETMHVYPYYCSEQVISSATPIIALYRAQRERGDTISGRPQGDVARAVAMLSARQREDGGIGYWSPTDWTSPWLSAYAGLVLLDARDAGLAKVDSAVLARLAAYLRTDLHGKQVATTFSPVAQWTSRRPMRLREQVAAVDFLSRYGKADVPAENELLRSAALLTFEDRARLAEVLVRRKQTESARKLMEPTWAVVRVEGRRAVLPDSLSEDDFYFRSETRALSRVLRATLAVDPQHALVGPLLESLSQVGRVDRNAWIWNTQDYAAAVSALAAAERLQRASEDRVVRVRAGRRVVLEGGAAAQRALRDSSIALAGLLPSSRGPQTLRLSLDASAGASSSAPVYFYLSVSEVPATPPVTPRDGGIRVERWYERLAGGAPVTSVAEGELVRVRLRITVPSTRYFVVLDDALPAGLEAVDLSLRTAASMPGPGVTKSDEESEHEEGRVNWFGSWDSGWWSPFDHRELRDDRVVYSANQLWAGTYTATYIARATTPGTFVRPPVHAEEMYNPAVFGRSDGGSFVVTPKGGGAPR